MDTYRCFLGSYDDADTLYKTIFKQYFSNCSTAKFQEVESKGGYKCMKSTKYVSRVGNNSRLSKNNVILIVFAILILAASLFLCFLCVWREKYPTKDNIGTVQEPASIMSGQSQLIGQNPSKGIMEE